MGLGNGVYYTEEIDKRLKTVYLPYFQDQYTNGNVLLSNMKRTSEFMKGGGKEVKWGARVGRNVGAGAFGPDGNLHKAGKQQGVQATSYLLNSDVTIEIDETTMKAAKTDKQAFDNVMTDETDRAVDDFRDQEERMLIGDGTGTLAIAASATNAGVVTISATGFRFNPLTLHLPVGKRCTIYQGALTPRTSATVRSTFSDLTVSAVDEENGTVTFVTTSTGSAVDLAAVQAGDTIATYDSMATNNAGAYGLEPDGFMYLCAASGSLHGIDPSTYPVWKSYVRSTSEDPSQDNVERVAGNARKNGGKITFIATSLGVVQKWTSLQETKKGFNDIVRVKPIVGMQMSPEDVFEGPAVPGCGPMVFSKHIPSLVANTAMAFFPDMSMLICHQAGEPAWMDADGRVLARKSGTNRFEGAYTWYRNYGTKSRNRLARHTQFNEL